MPAGPTTLTDLNLEIGRLERKLAKREGKLARCQRRVDRTRAKLEAVRAEQARPPQPELDGLAGGTN